MTTDKQNEAGIDNLLDALVFILKGYHITCSKNGLISGLALVNNQLTPSLLLEAAEKTGCASKLVKRKINKIPELILPCILILKNNHCCVLKSLTDTEAEIFIPDPSRLELEEAHQTLPIDELEKIYAGYAIFIKPNSQEKIVNEPQNKPGNMAWFWDNFWRYKTIHAEVLLASLLINIFTLVSPLYVMNVYDRVIPNNAEVTLWVLSSGVIVIYLFDLLLRVLRNYYVDFCNKKNDIILANLLFKRVLGMQMQYKPASIGAFANNFREFDALRDFFSATTLMAFIDLPFAILFLIIIFYIAGAMVIIPLLAIPIVVISALASKNSISESLKAMTESRAKKNAVLVESVLGLETLKCLNAESLLQKRWENHVTDTAKASFRARFLSNIVSSISYYTQQLVTIGNIVLGFYLVYQGDLTVGGLIACNILSGRTVVPFIQLTNLLSRFQESRQAIEHLDKIATMPQERNQSIKHIPCQTLQGHLEVKDLHFSYPNEKKKVLEELSFHIKSGEKVAILGRIGTGKSTIIKLLLNLYSPEKGTILIDNLDIAQLDPIDLRRNIGYVPQDLLLFQGSVRDNILMGNPTASDEQMKRCAEVAGVDIMVRTNPLGYNLEVGERGEHLSGGQRQTIAIARALINDPAVLLFDEPTSAMDQNTEKEILTRLYHYASKKTLIITTHKLSLLSLVDRIIIIDKGRVVMDGPKNEVINALSKNTKAL